MTKGLFGALGNIPGGMGAKLKLVAQLGPQVKTALKKVDPNKLNQWMEDGDRGMLKIAEAIHKELDKEFQLKFEPHMLAEVLKGQKKLLKKLSKSKK